ncbi:conserved protein of unknown function [Tenacibaculum jejuense]|uniref:Lipid/polyisoprenoid-binding YceI-like domain-containing protein n=2 Tax=Tenacibaculum jejuense TaxID=584609 RepID=A0A238U4E5_9FLAO|nr:conserved protein of unknown function [Tenacibaculum jejuense]
MFAFLCVTTWNLTAQKFVQNQSETKITFKIKNFGSYVDCLFSDVNFDVNFNKNDLTNSYINTTIAVSTVDTNNKSRDKSLKKEKYFNVTKYPNITLKSRKIEMIDANSFRLTGDLTIKGITKIVTIPIKVSNQENKLNISADFEINRLDYKVGKSSFILSKKVIAKVNYLGTK